MTHLFVPNRISVRVKVDGGNVLIIHNGRCLMQMPWEGARDMSKALRTAAGMAEQNAHRDKLIQDQATLIRAGFPLALTKDPATFKEAGNEAANNRELRRAMPGGIPDKVVFGLPSIKHALRRIGVKGIPSAEVFGKIGGR